MSDLNMLEQINQKACVIAVRNAIDPDLRDFTIEAANRAYLESVGRQDETFVPGRTYKYYIKEDPNFETFCLKCISTQKTQHQYINTELYNAWLDLYAIPLKSEVEDINYILFTHEMTPRPESDKLLDISPKTASEVLKTCIQLRKTDDFQAAMNSIIKDIRKMCESSACSILLTDFEARKCSILCVSHDNSFAMGDNDIVFMDEFFEVAETWRDLMAGSNCYIIANDRDMKFVEQKDPKWAESMKTSGIYNVVLYPLRLKNKILGYIWATNFNPDRIGLIKEVMELNAFILAAEIANHQMYEKMERMSRFDMLTGVFNRNEMNNRIADFTSGSTSFDDDFGVVFVDVNGLKTVNDVKGHDAGDELIKAVASRLSDLFAGYEIYRAGGDEFMVLAEGCPKGRFNEIVAELRKQEDEDTDIHFAVGSFYDELDHDLNYAIHAADASMYADKSAFYRNHPEFSRRTE
ncbi:MAG: GGDEF domain-containing protein [Lachnospiraceae bacterium]|nr:GGDEF domain-containing protein [Lachnospiraceae bacterium]